MNRHGHLRNAAGPVRPAGLWLVLVLGVSACQPLWSTPESQARDFIEALVTAPAETQPLRDIGSLPPEQDPAALVDDLAARVGLEFLRARRAQGVALKFVSGETRHAGDTQRTVVIHVSYLEPGTPATGEVRFQVRSEKDAGGRWRIRRVTGDN